jgi:hypothetical protein
MLRHQHCCSPHWEGDIHYDRETGKPLGLIRLPKGPLRLWIHPDKDGKFPPIKVAIGVDVSTGSGVTNSVASGCDASKGQKVFEYATPSIPPYLFSSLVLALCRLFKTVDGNPAYLIWEHDGPGLEFGQKIVESGYNHIYYRRNVCEGAYARQTNQPGWFPSVNNKRVVLEEYRCALEEMKYINFSDFALEQCLPYRYSPTGNIEHPSAVMTDDPTGAKINHGDHVIADALSWMGAKEMGVIRKTDEKKEIVIGSLEWRRQMHQPVDQSSWEEQSTVYGRQ